MAMGSHNNVASGIKKKFPNVPDALLGCVRHYIARLIRFKGHIPEDGGKQADF